jgi:hypothetical protein
MDVKTNPNHTKPAHIKSRSDFYEWLTKTIKIDGIVSVERDTSVDNRDLFSAGIRLAYKNTATPVEGLREGVLLEAGFANVTPNEPKDISSWAYDYATSKVEIIDNRTKAVACYDPGYTLVEKLQTISPKYRRQQERGETPVTRLLRCPLFAAGTFRPDLCRNGGLPPAQGRPFPKGGQQEHPRQSGVPTEGCGDARPL